MVAPTRTTPFVTLAIPCFNEERYIEACLDDVLAQDYALDRFEVLVGDGMSTDRTREILERVASRSSGRIRVIDNPRRLQAAALNVMIAEARGEIVIRLDVHARYQADFVRRCVEVLEETGADNVGGAARPLATTFFQRAVSAALMSKLAVGGSSYRNLDFEGFADTVFPGAFRKAIFERVGLFDPNAITNEDAELNQRILDAGGRIYVSRKIVVHYFPRDTFSGLAKQYFKYGRGRARTLLKHRRLPTIRPAIPFLTVLTGAGLLVTSPFQPFTPVALGLYAAATAFEAIRVSGASGSGDGSGRGHGLAIAPVVFAIFPVLHISHGVGFAAGLVHYLWRPDWDDDPMRGGHAPAGERTPVANVTP